MVDRLAAIFFSAAHWPAERPVPGPDLEGAISAYLSKGIEGWPAYAHLAEEFVCYVAARAEAAVLPPTAHAPDLFLAFGCITRIAPMQEAFRALHAEVAARVMGRRGATPDVVAEATQIMIERLLVAPPGAQPKLAQYGGRGPLRSWIATNAATTLAMLRRTQSRRRETSDDGASAALQNLSDPELAYLQSRYRVQVEEAFRRALASLDDRQRTLLRLSTAERMSIDQLGALYHVNRSTAARWLADARALLLEQTRAALRATLHLSPSECDSLFAMVRSQLDVSILRHLA